MCSREHLNMGSPYIPYSQRYWEAQFLLMTNWVRHTDIAEHLCLCQFSLWSIAEFAKFFPFVTLHLAGPHVLFHASIWWVPSWPRGGMHYLCFIPPRIPTFCLCSSRYKIHSCCTIGEPLCHWDFYGSIPKKKKSIETELGVWQVLESIHCWCPSQTQTVVFSTTSLKVPCQTAISMSDLHGNRQLLKEQPPRMKGCV